MSVHNATVGSLMKQPPVDVYPHWTLRGVAQALANGPIGAVVVRGAHAPGAAGSSAEGVVSERDIVHALAEGVELDATRAEDLMTRDLVCAAPHESALTVAARMIENEIRHVPVVEDGVVIGMVSERDLLRHLVEDHRAAVNQ